MKVWKATTLAGIVILCPILSAFAAELSVRLDPHTRVELTLDHEIVFHVVPQRGDAWTRLALRVCGDAARWKTLAELNNRPSLLVGVPVRIPYDLIRPELKTVITRALFPADRRHEKGWVHEVVSSSGPEGESLWRIAEWFAGTGEKYTTIREANPGMTLSTKPSQRVLIPEEVLLEPFRAEMIESDEQLYLHASLRDSVIAPAAVRAVDRRNTAALEYAGTGAERHAIYRLQEGEAIYSSVAVRFTGRIHADDVNEVIGEIVRFSGIEDVSRLPVGYPVKIPIDLLTTEFRPPDDPLRQEWEHLRRQRELLARGVEANRLEGVHVIIDPGHGGRDVGAISKDLYEAVYVYDIASRLKALLEKETAATVWVTTRSSALGYTVPDRDVLEENIDHVLLTTPNYDLSDPVVGVNLRWYLSNAIYRRVSRTAAHEKVVFLSLHADSLHPSLKGAMVYIPGERHVRNLSFEKSGRVYLARAEFREQPAVSHSAEEAFEAEAFSNRFAESLMSSFRREGLEVHPFDPVREHVVREKREWVPAVLRYNKVPTRVLVEVCNLANPEDLGRLTTRRWRGEVARALAEGIVSHFRKARAEDVTTVTAAR
ncbi:MAG: N-acetylmuramoyl-L-alanine amidase [Acidobacteria bacterium]|nr:N-acetylmuramoyl-L-alanine amidase [Acidobacteriota bacterium]